MKVIAYGLSGHCVDAAGGFCVFTADSAVVKVYKCGFIDVLASGMLESYTFDILYVMTL